MSQYEFDQLLQKYLAGACNPDEEKLILAWYQDMIRQSATPVNRQETEAIRHRIWQKLAAVTTGQTTARRPISVYGLAAAAALLVVALGWWYYQQPVTRPDTTAEFVRLPGSIERQNRGAAPEPIRLEDGSLVTLKPGGSLRYPAHFGPHSRIMQLTGEAFFQVSKDPARPFIVHTGSLVTEVLGTSFTIRSYEGAKAIEVAVVTGRVAVYRAADGGNRRSREVILKPNERITYSTHSQQLIPTLVEQPVQVVPQDQSQPFVFDGTPLPTVLARLQAVYAIDIYLESEGLTACVLNADLNDLSLYEQLDLVCQSVNAQYEVRGTSIFIIGSGCP